jgi:hypothetical protein
MKKPKLGPPAGFADVLKKIVAALAAAATSIAIFAGALFTPALIADLDSGDRDWVAALFATVLVVVASMLLHRRQVRHERLCWQREYTVNLIKMAMEDPFYAQCWGPRVSPPHIEERGFAYVNLMLMGWSYAWEQGQIDDSQVKAYARASFENEIPRQYWQRMGGWRAQSRRRRERAFYRIIADEYRQAVESGPPTRPYEPATDGSNSPPQPFGLYVQGGPVVAAGLDAGHEAGPLSVAERELDGRSQRTA